MVDGIVRRDGKRLDSGTGLKKAAVCRALASLEKRGVIVRTKQYAKSGGAIATAYQLHMYSTDSSAGTGETPVYGERQGTDTPYLKGETGGVHGTKQPLSTGRDTQYTVTNKQLNKNVNVSKKEKGGLNHLYLLTEAQSKAAHTQLVADDILAALGDKQSAAFYRLVAKKVPEAVVRRALSELKQSKARSKARVFTRQMMRYAEEQVEQEFSASAATFAEDRQTLVKRLKYE
jgi:hypothetical protein